MDTSTIGRVMVHVKIENLHDLYEVDQGRLKPEDVRSIEVPAALVDTRILHLFLPQRLIEELGLEHCRTRRTRAANNKPRDVGIYGVVRLTVQGRECTTEAVARPDNGPVVIGRIPLMMLDWVIDAKEQKLIGNPDHSGEQMFDMY